MPPPPPFILISNSGMKLPHHPADPETEHLGDGLFTVVQVSWYVRVLGQEAVPGGLNASLGASVLKHWPSIVLTQLFPWAKGRFSALPQGGFFLFCHRRSSVVKT